MKANEPLSREDRAKLRHLRKLFERHYGAKRMAAQMAGVSAAYITRILNGHRRSEDVMAVLHAVANTLNEHSKPVLYRNGVMHERVYSR